jgi:uncharacterized membrane protein
VKLLIRIVKLFQIVSVVLFLVSLTLFSHLTIAQIQFYSVDTTLDKANKAFVKQIIVFKNPESSFSFSIFGKIENFQATSNAGPVDCTVNSAEVSTINCKMNLTPEKRTLEINYETSDFVKKTENKIYFIADFSIYKDISSTFFAVKLPEGAVIASKDTTKTVYPENYQTASDGRRIIIQWNLNNLTSKDSLKFLKFQVIYEQIQPMFIGLSFVQLLVATTFTAIITGFGIYRYLYPRIKKPKEVILSVLDEYERKVIQILASKGGEAKQKTIVKETNLSKAKVSRIVKSLSERGLIEVQRIGRTNRLKLSKTKFIE